MDPVRPNEDAETVIVISHFEMASTFDQLAENKNGQVAEKESPPVELRLHFST